MNIIIPSAVKLKFSEVSQQQHYLAKSILVWPQSEDHIYSKSIGGVFSVV